MLIIVPIVKTLEILLMIVHVQLNIMMFRVNLNVKNVITDVLNVVEKLYIVLNVSKEESINQIVIVHMECMMIKLPNVKNVASNVKIV